MQILRHSKTSYFLVTDPINIKYLTGMDIDSGAVLATQRSLYLFADGRYEEAANKSASCGVRVLKPEKLPVMLKKAVDLGYESEHISVDRLLKLKRKNPNTKFIRRKGVIQHFRRTKGEDELKKFKRSQRITREILRRIPSALKSLPTERQLKWKILNWAIELGADCLAFDPIVAFGPNTSMPHHHSADRKLRRGDIVQIDAGVKYKGYCSDQSRVFFTGEISFLQEKALLAVEESKSCASDMAAPGISTHELDAAARRSLKKHGLEDKFVHSLGHGIGLEVHEGITLSQKAPVKVLLKNEIITVEPGVYFPGKFGIRLEDEIIVL